MNIMNIQSRRTRFVLAASLAWALLGFGHSHAAAILEEILVTAEKREASIQDTSISMLAYSGEELEALEVRELQSLSAQAPGMAFSRIGGEAQIYLRGVGNNTLGIGVDPGVALHLDGIYLGRAQMGLGQFMDLQRVEVLRGPQGTLYGRNATGGTINMISRGPGAEWEGYARAYYGSFNRMQGELAAGGPLSETAGFRLAVRGIQDDGFTDDLDPAGGDAIDDQNSWSARAIFDFSPNDDFSLRLQGDWTDFDSRNRSIRPLDDTGIGQTLGALPAGDFDETRNSIPSYLDYDTGGLSASLEWMLSDNLQLTSITGYREFEDRFRFNTDGTEIDVTETHFQRQTDQISEEIRLASVGLDRVEWLLGYYFYKESKEEALGLPNRKFASGGRPPFTRNSFNLFGENDTKAHAAFGQLAYFATDRLKLILGGRYSYEKKDDLGSNTFALNFDGLRNPANLLNRNQRRMRTDSWKAFTPKFGLDYRHSDDLLLYISASKGFKSGGTNSLSTSPDGFDPEFIWSYEGGIKSQWGSTRANVSVFYYDYRDLQVLTFIDGTTRIDNAASAEIIGAELDLAAELSEQLSWRLGASLLGTEYKNFSSAFGSNAGGAIVTDLSGNELINAPNLKLSAALNYNQPLDGGAALAFTGQVSYQSKVYFSKENEPLMSQGGYALVDARLAYKAANGAWEVAMVVRNLFDKNYFQSSVRYTSMNDVAKDPNNIGHPLAYPAEGRSFGVQAAYRF